MVCTSFYPIDNLQNTFRLSDDSNTCCFKKSILISLTFMTWNVDSMAKRVDSPPWNWCEDNIKHNRGALLSAPRLFENVYEKWYLLLSLLHFWEGGCVFCRQGALHSAPCHKPSFCKFYNEENVVLATNNFMRIT